MKHTKKLVSVPESEYNALLGLLTAGEPLKKEKILNDQKINATFARPRLSALEKGVHSISPFSTKYRSQLSHPSS